MTSEAYDRPTISPVVKNVFHLKNRVVKALREAGAPVATINDASERLVNDNVRHTLEEAMQIAAEYVDFDGSETAS